MSLALENTPCDINNGTIGFEAHKTKASDQHREKCFSPHPILEIPSTRCPCPKKWICARPFHSAQILRIRLEDGTFDGQVVLWAGDRLDVLNSVRVGPRSPRLFASAVRWGTLYFE